MKITEKPFSIPDHWRWVKLKELAEINPTFDRDDLSDDDPVSFVGMKRVEELSGRIDLSETEPLSEVRKGYTYFEDGDVLFAKITPCMENGKVAVARDLKNGVGFGSTEFHVIRHSEEATQEWIFHYLIQEGFRRDAKRAMTGSAGQKRVPTGYIEEVPIPLPPLPEQRRIVAKIEELFSNLDAGRADLQAAGQQLERYRLSVLQAAVEGRLTADWRRTHDPEPADQLLERILEEREKKWYKSRYKDPVEPEFGNSFPEAPDSWTVTSFDSVLSHVTSGPRGWSDYYHEGDGVFILAQNVSPGRLDFSKTKNVNPPSDASGRGRAMVQKNDLLVTIVGANTGDVCRVDRELDEHWVCQSVALMRPAFPATCKYLEIYLNSQLGQQQYERFAYGQGRPHLNFGQLKATPLLLPPLAEQKQIVDEIERLLSVADDAAATADREHTRAERLRQSILKQAFSGRLVPHEEDATPSSIAAKASEESDTGSSNDADSDVEDLMGSADPSKQIEMDL